MGHPTVKNNTPFHFDTLFTNDGDLKPICSAVLKATYRLRPITEGPLIPLREQPEINFEGEFFGDPEASCYRYEPEVAPYKLSTDIALIGTARAPEAGLTYFDVGMRVGDYVKGARIFGNRHWYRNIAGFSISQAEVIESLPLNYHNAFGGTDVTLEIAEGNPYEVRNPIGKGYHHRQGSLNEGDPLPNIEDPRHLIKHIQECPQPAGFGFINPHWHPRALLAGTYDEAWDKDRKPLLPKDFNPWFYNAASPGWITQQHLIGNEPVSVLNASPWPKLQFQLPGLVNPMVVFKAKRMEATTVQLPLDTVIIDTDKQLVTLLYRACLPLNKGPHDAESFTVDIPGMTENSFLELA